MGLSHKPGKAEKIHKRRVIGMKRGVYGTIVIAAVIMLIGVAGASDNEAINIIKADALCALSLAMVGIGLFGLYLEDARERNSIRRVH